MRLRSLWELLNDSVALRLTLYAGALAVVTSMMLLAIFYLQTTSLLEAQFSRQVSTTAQRLQAHFDQGGRAALVKEIKLELTDQVNAETEVLILIDEDGKILAGNALGAMPVESADMAESIQQIPLEGGSIDAYSVTRRLPDGSRLTVGQDVRDLHHMTQQLNRLLLLAGVFILVVTALGSFMFRRALQQRVEIIRRTAAQVSDGLLNERVPVSRSKDEFALLTHDINHMLDRIERLMTGVRHVSDSVAHNLRTPIARILLSLRSALRPEGTETELRKTAEFAVSQLEELGKILEKLLQIAEMESGMRRTAFSYVDFGAVVKDVVDLYSAFAEDSGALVTLEMIDGIVIEGDRDMLASAVANLVDNALKYAGDKAVVNVKLRSRLGRAVLTVTDNGPGIPEDKRDRIGQRFYRAGRTNEGYGLGLASVMAIVKLHAAEFRVLAPKQGAVIELDFPRSSLN